MAALAPDPPPFFRKTFLIGSARISGSGLAAVGGGSCPICPPPVATLMAALYQPDLTTIDFLHNLHIACLSVLARTVSRLMYYVEYSETFLHPCHHCQIAFLTLYFKTIYCTLLLYCICSAMALTASYNRNFASM